ncbi:MAG: hypothetical protein ABSF94_02945 [Steroidobacteraceae bacterium]|jgi:MFS family permease
MELLRALPQAAPILLRHLAAYADLVGQDLAQAQRNLRVRLIGAVLIAVSLMFALGMACLAVLAYTWNTPDRLASIAWMGAAFLLSAIIAALVMARLVRAQAPFFAAVKYEWREDLEMLARISDDRA